MTPAVHSSALELGGGKTQNMGLASGYLVKAAGRTLYHAGDTALFGDMSLIGRHSLDLALIPIGDFYTMGAADALYALDLLRPKLTVPMHYNTFPEHPRRPHRLRPRRRHRRTPRSRAQPRRSPVDLISVLNAAPTPESHR